MQEILCNGTTRIVTLTTDNILELHDVLCKNYELLPEMEPVSPTGVKNNDMLESAISRQLVGAGDYFKYSSVFSNCATLVFGLVQNHSFHNGNKRIGFLALIKHLYCNGYIIKPGIRHNEIYELLRTLADSDSTLESHANKYNYLTQFYKQFPNIKKSKWGHDVQIQYLTSWLRLNTEHKNTKFKFKTLPINDLVSFLRTKDLETQFTGKYLTISKKVSFVNKLLGKKVFRKSYSVKDSKSIGLSQVEQIRNDFSISFLDGVDNSSFYDESNMLNDEITSYKRIIYRLAKT